MPAENRAMRLTGPGMSAIAVVRLVGPLAPMFLERYFSKPVPPGRAFHGELSDGTETIDDPMVVRTSADSVDISLHGSVWIVRRVLDLARSFGFEADDSSLTASDWPDAEGLWPEVLAALPGARTPLAVKALLAQPSAWANGHREPAEVLLDRSLQRLLSLPAVALVGPANVGKSTLANTLFGQARSITADLPGTTRDWVGGIADISGLAVMLIDTPGARETADPIERAAQAGSAPQVNAAELVIVVLDRSLAMTDHERSLLAEYPSAIIVANKADRPAAWDSTHVNAIGTIATEDAGVEPLRRAILAYFGCENFDIHRPRLWPDAQRA